MKIMLIGSGGREHAIATAFAEKGHTSLCIPGSDGIATVNGTSCLPHLNLADHDALLKTALEQKIDLVVVGPEQPLADGLADSFKGSGIPFFGPSREGALLESSKAFAKGFMASYQIPTARYRVCNSPSDSITALKEASSWNGIVVKPSGLTGGKGVRLYDNAHEALPYVHQLFSQSDTEKRGKSVVIEERLDGQELSLFAMCCGEHYTLMGTAQDHKRLFDGDGGPNTGGMGAYCPAPFADQRLLSTLEQEVIRPTIEGLQDRGISYCGILYFGLMLTTEGPYVLEYNCRFGDPEAQALLPLMESDLAEMMISAALEAPLTTPRWKPGNSCTVVIASEGYPDKPQTGRSIQGIANAENEPGCQLFHAGTKRNQKGEWETAGGRVLAVTGIAQTLEQAITTAYRGVDHINFDGMQLRNDIGAKGLHQEVEL